MKFLVSICSCLLFLSIFLADLADASFPMGPRLERTPGSLCEHPTEYRYPERIPYCKRNVESELKYSIILKYDQLFGYTISKMPRNLFKIDHLIPLCAGGSNDESNLWPQHKDVYAITDPLEPVLCEKMSQGKLLQAQALKLILQAKNNLRLVPQILAQLMAL